MLPLLVSFVWPGEALVIVAASITVDLTCSAAETSDAVKALDAAADDNDSAAVSEVKRESGVWPAATATRVVSHAASGSALSCLWRPLYVSILFSEELGAEFATMAAAP